MINAAMISTLLTPAHFNLCGLPMWDRVLAVLINRGNAKWGIRAVAHHLKAVCGQYKAGEHGGLDMCCEALSMDLIGYKTIPCIANSKDLCMPPHGYMFQISCSACGDQATMVGGHCMAEFERTGAQAAKEKDIPLPFKAHNPLVSGYLIICCIGASVCNNIFLIIPWQNNLTYQVGRDGHPSVVNMNILRGRCTVGGCAGKGTSHVQVLTAPPVLHVINQQQALKTKQPYLVARYGVAFCDESNPDGHRYEIVGVAFRTGRNHFTALSCSNDGESPFCNVFDGYGRSLNAEFSTHFSVKYKKKPMEHISISAGEDLVDSEVIPAFCIYRKIGKGC